MADAQAAGVLRFGSFEADLGNRQLYKNGASISLRGQPFDILALLLEHPGQLVTREQLRARLWPAGTVVEFDHGIDAAITKLRETLGDDAQHPRFIATVPRHGYRFIATVTAPASSADVATAGGSGIAPPPPAGPVAAASRRRWLLWAGIPAVALALGFIVLISRFASPGAGATASRAQLAVSAPASDPAPASIAVLPFADLSERNDQEYFADGLAEELLDRLANNPGLRVIARTSSFSFKGKAADIPTIAAKLKVANILEGSVRRSGNHVRISTQLVRAADGEHLWSQTYDRDLGDVLSVQSDIAIAVANALKVRLLGDVGAGEAGGTPDPQALDAYLRGRKTYLGAYDAPAMQAAIADYSEAIRIDPNYALAFAGRSVALGNYGSYFGTGDAIQENFNRASDDANRAITLAPDLAAAHLALANYFFVTLQLARADEEYARALTLAPGNADVLQYSGLFAALLGRTEAGIAAARKATVLDPLNPQAHFNLGALFYLARRYEDSLNAYASGLTLDPNASTARGFQGQVYYLLGRLEEARTSCEIHSTDLEVLLCQALTYQKLGRSADAEQALAKLKVQAGDAAAFQLAEVYTQWGDTRAALTWLERAARLRDSGLPYMRVDALLDPIRQEPRFQEIERALKFPT
jgi:TolB-like protein/DNA-binding winged helix-turn-helix (wHTH) protein/Tfp pilus assembly protein PilF